MNMNEFDLGPTQAEQGFCIKLVNCSSCREIIKKINVGAKLNETEGGNKEIMEIPKGFTYLTLHPLKSR